MTIAGVVRLARSPFERLFDALIDPARCERTSLFLLAGYAVTWSLYGVIAKGSQDIHFDMGEMVAWSHEVTLGTPKHPPLAAWLVRIWFSIMPAEPWAYYTFAVILATAALWIAWRLSARYLTPEKRAVGIALLTLVPFYNFHALKFNANSVLIPFWAAATWWFLRSFETRRAGWAIAAGGGAAAAMLGKYWSIFLLAGLALAALTDPRRRSYLASPAPYLTLATLVVLLAPHAGWVVAHDFVSFSYALGAHPATPAGAFESIAYFVAGTLAYIAVPIVLGVLAARPDAAAIRDTLRPAEPERRTILIAFAAPLVLAIPAALLLQVKIMSLWAMSAMTLLPVALLSSPRIKVPREAAIRLLALAVVAPLVLLALSPAIAVVLHRKGVPNYATHYRLIAEAVEHAWRERTPAPLHVIGSYTDVVNGIVFYFASQPSTYDIISPAQTPWVDEVRIKRDGIAMVCPQPEVYCVEAMNALAARYAGAQAEDVTLARRHFGALDNPVRYRIVIIPPE